MPTLPIMLDTNEYIFGITQKLPASVLLLDHLSSFKTKIPRIILDELHDNLTDNALRQIYQRLIAGNVEIVEEELPPVYFQKYQRILPESDAIIAAYCEYLKVKVLVSENRHFLINFKPTVFTVMAATDFVQKYLSKIWRD